MTLINKGEDKLPQSGSQAVSQDKQNVDLRRRRTALHITDEHCIPTAKKMPPTGELVAREKGPFQSIRDALEIVCYYS